MIIARGRVELFPGRRPMEVRGLVGVASPHLPAQSLVLGILNGQAMSFSERKIFVSFLLNIITSLGLVVDRLRGLAVPFLKLRRQQGHLPTLH